GPSMFPIFRASILKTRVLLFVTALIPRDSLTQAADGEAIWKKHCVSCHGSLGEGTPDVPAPLFGDRPTVELAELISRTMPEGSPEDCTGDEASAVAAWMQQNFYSAEAQARLHPPHIALSRLTVSQYRNAVADLFTSFLWSARPNDQRGLAGSYFADRRFRRDQRRIERTDPVISFAFGEGSPDAEQIPAEEFSIQWRGSLIVQETGTYEFILNTENGAKLFVNDSDTPLIDVWVRSGSETSFRATRFLLAGRLYPVSLDWFKFKEPSASIALQWKPPHGVEQLIPAANLTTESSPPVIIPETAFPPDDRSDGYERGHKVSREWDEACTYAAMETADKVIAQLSRFVRERDEERRKQQIRQFATDIVERAFRRPLDEETRRTIVDASFEAMESDEEALRRIIIVALKSPEFLYHDITESDDDYGRASRLSFALLDSMPDKSLLEAAAKGQLGTEQQLRQHAWRLVNDPRSRSRLVEFFRTWMTMDRIDDVSKDSEHYPDFTPELAADLRTSLDLFLQQLVSAEQVDMKQLLLSDTIFMNARMAEFYGAGVEAGTDFVPVTFEPEQRAGILTHPFLLSAFAYHSTGSPIHRGVFVSRGILGRAIKPPPIAVAPTAPELAPDLTTRERVTIQTSPEVCAGCHQTINALGFSLENFDTVGRFRATEKDKPIDASGGFLQRNGETVQFNGARALAAFAASSDETRRSLARQLFHFMVHQPILAYGPETIGELSDHLKSHNDDIRHLVVEIAVRSAMRRR
ncbi:MAG: DUF1592 domain-containing protein, partial [Planctomycetaceae bacterium]|nr:DUF1592 domain-containing protein [Planctomycetaceae bacterium]